jgi:hypothetical protein
MHDFYNVDTIPKSEYALYTISGHKPATHATIDTRNDADSLGWTAKVMINPLAVCQRAACGHEEKPVSP